MQTAQMPQAGKGRYVRLVCLAPLLFLVGCSGASRSGNGALIGGGAGAVAGNVIAKAAGGDRTLGTILGGAAGALLGKEVAQGGTSCR